jgi:hypothetical protein
MIRVPINRLVVTMIEEDRDIRAGHMLMCLHLHCADPALRDRIAQHDSMVIGYVEPGVRNYQWSPHRLLGNDEAGERVARAVGGAMAHRGVWRCSPLGPRFTWENMGSRGLNVYAVIRFSYHEIEDAMGHGSIPRPFECADPSPDKPLGLQRRLTEAPELLDNPARLKPKRTVG